jgi:hypothetical protein
MDTERHRNPFCLVVDHNDPSGNPIGAGHPPSRHFANPATETPFFMPRPLLFAVRSPPDD